MPNLNSRLKSLERKLEKDKDKGIERSRRAELTMLDVLIERYPEQARRFLRKRQAQTV